jgi:hypothetical protein
VILGVTVMLTDGVALTRILFDGVGNKWSNLPPSSVNITLPLNILGAGILSFWLKGFLLLLKSGYLFAKINVLYI